jgi:hypothetical protein
LRSDGTQEVEYLCELDLAEERMAGRFGSGRSLVDEFFSGRTVDFKHSVVIMISNLGADRIQQLARQGGDLDRLREELTKILCGSFRPEFINRIDEIIVRSTAAPSSKFDRLVAPAASLTEIFEAVRRRLLERNWDLGVVLTDLPLSSPGVRRAYAPAGRVATPWRQLRPSYGARRSACQPSRARVNLMRSCRRSSRCCQSSIASGSRR